MQHSTLREWLLAKIGGCLYNLVGFCDDEECHGKGSHRLGEPSYCFLDDNKQTAALALIEFLERNGFTLEVTNDELYEFTIDVATSTLSRKRWLSGSRRKQPLLKRRGFSMTNSTKRSKEAFPT